ncbi:MAG TPA: hypothetical protein VLX44_07045 [Xanthobacteraceae bacterium]|nr:hypothetical protein [Xanthobacteraceae bacterium]
MHGADPAAQSANAVFFRNETEACEALLTRIARRQSPDAWFWSSVSGASDADAAQHVVGVIEKLLQGPAAWSAVAAAVQAAIEPDDPVALLGPLSEARARQWLSMIGGGKTAPQVLAPVRFAGPMSAAIARAVAALGPEDPRTVWLAALGVVRARPSDLERGVVVSRARASVRAIDPPRRKSPQLSLDREETLRPERGHGATIDRAEAQTDARSLSADSPQRPAGPGGGDGRSAAAANDVSDGGPRGGSPDAEPRGRSQPEHGTIPDRCLGAATAGAGLYFLLNAVRYLKAPHDGLDPWFLAHLLRRMAHHAGVAADDPILLWTRVTLDQDDPEEIDERLLRLCALKIRRWCWRDGRIAAREVICRPGRVTLTATDLDVSLALDAIDIRIRRIGLDLDPGWVPWFGRVVRFHYLPAGELHA